ncbi:hypothetical protein V476_19090 [Pseudomonas syringae KCTC 12500]|uniref:hypothetical protein n=1 Tax=Pseudomonas syringae TaxID=317 RepID=UPI00046863CF|nr:hypothetical protein [Pseudomonas syringae]KMY03124.1 hypothetical protein V476_19090 [Pseudomonas syringae KCTC 12500]KPY71236.1 Uncharacterized protein ALO45_03622 [Pseudomonas syringae pv. syringae]POR86039.1 hypothetical protein BKM21_10110 [Pseudomonas syringae pv. syringae]
MARKRKVTTETVKASALELLDLTLQATNKRFADAIKDDYPCEAALISASVALLKMVEAKGSLTDDDKAGDLAAQRQAFNDRKPTQTKHTPEDIAALYKGNN